MPVTLPDTPGTVSATPRLLDFGGLITPALGGEQQRINRLGNRWGITATLPPMRIEPDGRRWTAALCEGLTDTVLFPFPQVDFNTGVPGAPVVNGAGQTGSTINLSGFTPGYFVRKGQFFSVISAGRRYLYQVRADVATDAAGAAAVPITPMLRKSPANGDACEFAVPMIEGFLQDSGIAWTVDLARTVGLEFTIFERA